MENENSIIGIKINETNIPAKCIMIIKEINGMQLPNDYLEFMHKHNGGEGDVGKNSYMQFIKLEELVDYNND